MATKYLIRCKTKKGQHVIQSLTADNTVDDLKQSLSQVTGIDPYSLKVLVGYPPKPLDLSHDNWLLNTILPHSAETLIVEEIPVQNKRHAASQAQSLQRPPGILMRRVVPANNSCLFTSIHYSLSSGQYDEQASKSLRHIIADVVASDMDTYSEAFLGKPNKEYCTWILNEDNWGGGIEISILSQHYNMEIVAVDTQNVSKLMFGEDANYPSRILLIYDGIHYDPLFFEPLEGEKNIETIFSTSDESIIQLALEVAQEANKSRQYTDVQNFTIKCLVCSKALKGQDQAQQHAIETKHTNFGEI